MKLIVTSLPAAEKALIGLKIPFKLFNDDNSGAIGLYLEQILIDLGYAINQSTGPDLPTINLEIKSRAIEATSAHTIGSMNIDDIIRTPYYQSNICDKFQFQFRVLYSRTFCEFTDAKVYNFTANYIQTIIEESYESSRKLLTVQYHDYLNNADSKLSPYARGLKLNGDLYAGYFENTNKLQNKTYDFRLKDSDMKRLENMARSAKLVKNLFEIA